MSVRSNNPFELETLLLNKMSLKFDLTERGIKRAFASYDKDGNGLLNLREMTSAVQLYLNGIPRNDIKRLMKCYDVNGDGYISFEEFYAMLSSRNATRPQTERRGRRTVRIPQPTNNNTMIDMFIAEEESSRARYLKERKKNREVDEAMCILHQAKVLEDMCTDMEIEIKQRERLAQQNSKYSASCDASLRAHKEAGKPLFPIYAAMGYKEPDILPGKRNTRFSRRGKGVNILYETDLQGARSNRTSTAPAAGGSNRRSGGGSM